MKCIKCGAELNDDARFCDACGAAQKPETARCRKCDAEIKAGAKFCSVCGALQSTGIDTMNCFSSLMYSGFGLSFFALCAFGDHFASSRMVALMCLFFVVGGIFGAFAVCRKRYLGIAAIALAIVMPLVLFLLSNNAENKELKEKEELRRELSELRRKQKTQVENTTW